MFVIKKMRLNKFQPRPIVSNRSLALSVGDRPATIQSKETSDCLSEPQCDGSNKNKLLGLAQEISAKAYAHSQAEETAKLNKTQVDL